MTISNTGCPHLTGVVCNGYEECEMGKACDCDCEWIDLKKAEQKLEKIKDICHTYQMEYTVNNGVQLLTTKILQIIEEEE